MLRSSTNAKCEFWLLQRCHNFLKMRLLKNKEWGGREKPRPPAPATGYLTSRIVPTRDSAEPHGPGPICTDRSLVRDAKTGLQPSPQSFCSHTRSRSFQPPIVVKWTNPAPRRFPAVDCTSV